METLIIGIGGPSQAGKSTLAGKIAANSSRPITILSQDDFVKPASMIPKIQGRTDWETPESVDKPRLQQAIEVALTAESTVIIEGIFAFSYTWLTDMYDKSLLLMVDKDTFLKRRRQDSRWGHEPEWFLEHVWSSYQTNGEAVPKSTLILDQNYRMQEVLEYIWAGPKIPA